jgi:O-antigen/teichoic acid export membrane protein
VSERVEPAISALPREPSLGARASRGAIVSVVGQGASQGLRLVGNLVLARMLFPEAFGLMALVNMLLFGLQALSDLGLGPALVRHPRGDDPVFLDTAWTLAVLRGAALTAIGMALAWPMATFYREPTLMAIVPVASVSAFVMGLLSTKVASLTRHLRPAPVVAIEVGSQAVGLVAMVVFAKLAPSVWALVVGGLVSSSVRVLLSHVAIAGPINRFRWDAASRADLMAFGKWLFVSSIFTFIGLRADVGILGRLLPVDALGVYSIGIVLAQLVRDVLQQITRFVIMPALSESHRAGGATLAANWGRVRRVALPAALVAILGATLFAPPFFYLLYDERYHDAGWIAQLAMAGVWFSYLTDVMGSALLAAGDSRGWALVNAVKAFGMLGGCAAGFWIGGLPGLMAGATIAALAAYLAGARVLVPHGIRTLAGDLPHTFLAFALGLVGAIAPRLTAGGDRHRAAIHGLVIGTAILGPYALWVGRRLLRARR